MKHTANRILQSTALKLMLLFGLFGVNAAALAAASVTLTSPTNNTTVAAPGSFVLTATASSTNSTVKSVSFYRGTTLLRTDTSAPYSYTWNSVAAGTYNLTAKVIDNRNATATSAIVTVKVINDVPPTVSLTSPAANTVSTAPASFTLTASANSTTSTVSKVDFYNGTTLLGTATASPYTYTWSNVAAGTYSLTAKATDALGKSTTSSAVTVISNAPPTVSITAPANNTALNAPASFTLSASATDSDGSISRVEYFNGTTLIGSATASPYTLAWNNIALGTYTITAKATDNRGAATTSAPITLISKQASSSTTVSATPNPATAGQATTLTATVTGNNPGGSITFKDGATTVGTGTLSAGTASFSYTPSTAGSHSITAVYAGDTNNTASTSAATALSVNTATSTTSVTATPNPATAGQVTTLNASVTGVNPSGTVTFKDGATTLGIGTLTAGVASLNYTFNTAGAHSITAEYAGDSNNAASTSTAISLTVNKVVSTTTLTVTPNPAKPLDPITLTATVTGTNPSGTVTFMEGANTLGTAILSNGTASFTTSFMTDGQKMLTVNYSGDPVNDTSTSAVVNMDVAKVASTITLGVTPNPAKPLEPITMTATVTGFNLAGTVNFMDGNTLLGSSPVNAGVATFTTSFMDAGIRTITAVYSGDPVNTPSSSFVVNMDVAKVSSTITLGVTPNPAKPLEPITMTATVTGFNPAGTVNFMDGNTLLGSSPVNAGIATFTTSFMDAGIRTITAVYSGDPVNTPSTSFVVNLDVAKVASTITLGVTPNPAKPLEPITMTATVTGFNLAGTVNFMDGATLLGTSPVNAGIATFTTNFMDAGIRPITAVYSGDPVNTPSTSFVVNMDVAKVATSTTLSVTPNPARPGEPITMTVTVTGLNPTGVVSFTDGGYVVGGANLIGGVATFSYIYTNVGTHTLTAIYGADPVNASSTSDPVNLVINSGVAQVYYIHTDHLNTPRSVTDTSGVVVWQWDNSDPFGNNSANENPSGQGAFNFNLRFAGQYFDKETNTHQNYFRDYDPSIGRYTTSDPIGLAGGVNTYAYVGGNPLSYTDPTGLKTFQCKKPLHALGSGGAWAYKWLPLMYHQYSCVVDAKGKWTCDGQDRGAGGKGKPSTDTMDDAQQCKQTAPDSQCFEQCLKDEWAKPRPAYGIPIGTDCQEYDYDVNQSCRAKCDLATS